MNELLLAALSGATVWFAFAAVGRRDPVVGSRIAALAGSQGIESEIGRPRPLSALLRHAGRRFPGSTADSNRELLTSAGMSRVPVESLRGAQLFLAALGFLMGVAFGPLAVVLAPLGVMIGYRVPRTVLTARSRRRKDELAAALPDVVDLLAVCTHAGLNISLSLKRVALRAAGPMGREIQRVVEEMALGIPRSQALENLAARNGVPELESLVRVLLNSERFGTQISASLESFSADIRSRRKRSAEEQARKAPVKILFPLVFLILPAFILLSVVPLLISAFESLDL